MLSVIEMLYFKIDDIAWRYRDAPNDSYKRMIKMCNDFIDKIQD